MLLDTPPTNTAGISFRQPYFYWYGQPANPSLYEFIIDSHIFKRKPINQLLIDSCVFTVDYEILERKIGQSVVFRNGHIEEGIAGELYVFQPHLVAVGKRHIRASLQIKKLGPGLYVQQTVRLTRNVFDR